MISTLPLPDGFEPEAFMESIIEPKQSFRPKGTDKAGLDYEILDAKGQRVRLLNSLVEFEIHRNESLRYLRYYTRSMYDIQKMRVSSGNREGALERLGISEVEQVWMNEHIHVDLEKLEKRIETRCKRFLPAFPIWTEHLQYIRGIGVRYASSLIAIIVTPRRYRHFGACCAHAGYALNSEGLIQKRRKKEASNWAAELKMTLYKISCQFVKQGGGYRTFFDQFKRREVEKNEARPKAEQLIKGHVHARALRMVSKLFLSHTYQRWCELEGIPIRQPYAIEYLGHQTIIEPFRDG